jgi:hypothetical protein
VLEQAPERGLVVALHLLDVITTLVPRVRSESYSQQFSECLLNRLSDCHPVGQMVALLKQKIECEERHFGAAYLRNLLSTAEGAHVTNGSRVLFYDAECRFFLNFLAPRKTFMSSIEHCFPLFVKFYLASQFHSQSVVSFDQVVPFCYGLQFTEESDRELIRNFQIVRGRGPIECLALPPPYIPLSCTKVLMTPELVLGQSPIDPNENFLLVNPGSTAFNRFVVNEIGRFFQKNQGEVSVSFPIIAAGNDCFFGTILLLYIRSLLEKPAIFLKTAITFFIIPLESQGTALLADYIAAFDPVYDITMRRVYSIVSQTAPTMDEQSKISTASIEDPEPKFERNPWFGAPSPSLLLQFSIQHYLMFAHDALKVYVWQCRFMHMGKHVIVPFVTSLHFNIKKGKGPTSCQCESPQLDKSFDIRKLHDLWLWNANADRRVSPQEPSLLLERTMIAKALRQKDYGNPKKCRRDVVRQVTVRSDEGPMMLTIDDRAYEPVPEFAIEPFRDPTQPDQQLALSIATFTAIHV